MLLELGLEIRDLGLELLELREQGEQDRSDGGRSSLPVRRGNAEGRRKLTHGTSLKQLSPPVKGDDPSQPI
jgi:hypothetical protein